MQCLKCTDHPKQPDHPSSITTIAPSSCIPPSHSYILQVKSKNLIEHFPRHFPKNTEHQISSSNSKTTTEQFTRHILQITERRLTPPYNVGLTLAVNLGLAINLALALNLGLALTLCMMSTHQSSKPKNIYRAIRSPFPPIYRASINLLQTQKHLSRNSLAISPNLPSAYQHH
jgi:hypothetical protein